MGPLLQVLACLGIQRRTPTGVRVCGVKRDLANLTAVFDNSLLGGVVLGIDGFIFSAHNSSHGLLFIRRLWMCGDSPVLGSECKWWRCLYRNCN